MTWDERIDKAQRVIDLLIKAEVHAILIIGMGIILTFHQQKETGTALITLGAGIFKGNR
jgi:uncharacterized iron-regulated protein